ncbi:hypothetical protein HBB16_17230 [Pseudonocardia sp. MCCB 268]|nr:hypothetical protein [Pseudonocardia cytotoxica]
MCSRLSPALVTATNMAAAWTMSYWAWCWRHVALIARHARFGGSEWTLASSVSCCSWRRG